MSFKQIQLDNVDKLPPAAPHADSAPWQVQRRWLPDWRALAVLCGFTLTLLLILYWLFGRDVRYWIQYGDGGKWIQAALWIAFGYVLLRAIISAAMRGLIIEQRGYKVPVWQAHDALKTLAPIDYAYADRLYPNAAAVTISQAPTMPMLDSGVIDGTLVSDNDVPNIGPLAVDEWMRKLNNEPHAIFAAKTKGGKSTMAKIGLQPRISAGESIFVIDPHSNGWLDLPGVGGGLNWQEVEDAMFTVQALYKQRMDEREYHMRHTGHELSQNYFPRVTVIFDEANESRTEITKRHSTKSNPWPAFTEIMSSGARKVGMSLWLICQSALIKNLGGSTVMRRNFTVFALDHMTIRELIEDEEPMRHRRELIVKSLGGARFPAATVLDGQAFLLDRTDIDQLEPSSARGCAWDGWDYDQRCGLIVPRSKPVVSASVRPSATVSTSFSPADLLSVPASDAMPASLTKPVEQIAWLAANTTFSTRAIRDRLECDYNLVVAITGKVRGPRGAKLRDHFKFL